MAAGARRHGWTLAAAGVLFVSLVAAAASVAAPDWGPLVLLDREIKPGERQKFSYSRVRSFEAVFLDTAVFASRGVRPGPTLCLTALVHGDERNGFEIARMVVGETDPRELAGTLLALPAVNVNGFRTGSRYMPDRRDLNRAFPGTETASNTSLVAKVIFDAVKQYCDVLIDLHTGSFERANLPQVRVDLGHPRALDLARRFGAPVVLGGAGPRGSLRREAMEAGIPAIIYEAGLPMRFELEEIRRGVQGVRNVMVALEMIDGPATEPTPTSRVFSRTRWLRVPTQSGGVYYPDRALGDVVEAGEVIAHIDDPFTDEHHVLLSEESGTVIGMAVPQVVFSGYALIHIAQN